MVEDNNKPGSSPSIDDEVTAKMQVPQISAPKAPEAWTLVKLEEMTDDMFKTTTVKKLLALTKIIGATGHNKSFTFSDKFTDQELVTNIEGGAQSYKNFESLAELLLNRILQGKTSEETVKFRDSFFHDSIQSWLFFHIDMFAHDDTVEQEKLAKSVLNEVLQSNLLGDDPAEVIQKLLLKAHSTETRNFIALIGIDLVDPQSRRAIVEAEEQARRDFQANFHPKPQPAAEQSPQPQAAAAPEVQKNGPIAKASCNIMYWPKNTKSASEVVEIKLPQGDNDKVDPIILPNKPFHLHDGDENIVNVTSTIEIEDDRIVLIRQGQEDIIDLDSGLPIQKIEIEEGKIVKLQIGDRIFQLQLTDIIRKPAAATPEPTASAGDSKPNIDTRETILYNLPAVLITDNKGENILGARPCLDENERIINIGTDPWSDIVVPPNPKMIIKAHILFFPGTIIVRTGPLTPLGFVNRPQGFIPGDGKVKFEEVDVLKVGANENAIYLKVSHQYPFYEADIKKSLNERLNKIEKLLDANPQDPELIKETEKLIKSFNKTLGIYEKAFDTTSFIAKSAGISGKTVRLKENLEERKSLEMEEKKVLKQHFDVDSGETAETPRPFKYAVLVQKNADLQTMHIIFPPALTTGKSPVNALELRQSRESKYGIQDNECTFVPDGANGVRMALESRTDRKSKILINGEMPGTRGGKTHELDMLRPPLCEGDKIEIGTNHFTLEMNHEFTMRAVKPYALKYMKEIMEVLVLMPESSDEGEKRNVTETLEHFLQTGIITPAELKTQRALFEKEKATREITSLACGLLDEIREQNEELMNYIEDDRLNIVGLPYDVAKLRVATEFIEEKDVRWDDTGWTREQYRAALAGSARTRLFAYDKKLLQKRTELQDPKWGTRLISIISKGTSDKLQDEKAALQRAIRQVLVEMVSIIELGVAGPEYIHGWMGSRLDAQQAEQAEAIACVHQVMNKIHEGETFTVGEVTNMMSLTENMTYGEFFNAQEIERDMPMADFILAKIKARAFLWLQEAGEGENIGGNADRIEECINAGLLTYESLGTTSEVLADLRENEQFLAEQKAKLKAGHEALEEIMSSAEPDLEAIVNLAKRLSTDEVALSDEEDEAFKIHCRQALEEAVKSARIGHMTAYTAILAASAVRLKITKPKEFGTTAEELQRLHETTEVEKEADEIDKLIEEAREASLHNLHPLLKLKTRLEEKNREDILEDLVNERLEKMFVMVLDGEDPSFLEMIIDDMRQYGFEPMMKKCLGKALEEVIESLYLGVQTKDTIRPFVETLNLLNLGELIDEIKHEVFSDFSNKIEGNNPPADIQERYKKLGEDLRDLGLYS